MTENNMINVIVKDGNRTVNWDYFPDKTIMEILEENGFKPVPGTMKVQGLCFPCHRGEVNPALRLSDCPQDITPDGKQMRVVITLKSQPEKKPEQKKEVRADVR